MADDLKHASRKYYSIVFDDADAKMQFREKGRKIASFQLLEEEETRVYISVEDQDLNELIALLSSLAVCSFSNRKETLEGYFMKFYKEERDFGGALQ